MSLIARAILLRRQLKEDKKRKKCERCHLVYDRSLEQCPHCSGLNDRQVAEMLNAQKKMQMGNILHIALVLGGLSLFLTIMYCLF
jgi:hypothetical protein